MKKIFQIALCALTSFALIACNSDAPAETGSPSKDKTLDPNADATSLTVTGMT